MTRTLAVVWSLALSAAILVLAGLALLAGSWTAVLPDAWGFRGFTALFAVAYTALGAVVAARRPTNVVGWLLLLVGVEAAIQLAAEEYAIYGTVGRAGPLPGAVFAGWVESWIWFLGVGTATTYLLLVFPSGRLPSSRWRVVAALAAAVIAVAFAGLAFTAGPLNNAPFDNPYPLLGPLRILDQPLFVLAFVALGFLSAAAAASLVGRYRRASGTERQQLKWLALEGILVATVIALNVLTQFVAPALKAAQVALIVIFALFPVIVGLAILRYRLYDIDVLINRALVYGATTAVLAVAFFVGIIVLQAALRPLTGGSEAAVAASTLLSFALFQPLRRRVQSVVDQRFYRSRYDAARTLDDFSVRLRDQVALDAVRADLLDAVRETVQPAHASVWLRGPAR